MNTIGKIGIAAAIVGAAGWVATKAGLHVGLGSGDWAAVAGGGVTLALVAAALR